MGTLRKAITRVLFWSYERGTWQYDIAVAGITLFVLFLSVIARLISSLFGPRENRVE